MRMDWKQVWSRGLKDKVSLDNTLGRRCNLVVANTKLTSTWHCWTGPCSQPQRPEGASKLGCAAGITEGAWPAKDTSLGQTKPSRATRLCLWSLPKLEKPQLHTTGKGKGKHPCSKAHPLQLQGPFPSSKHAFPSSPDSASSECWEIGTDSFPLYPDSTICQN